MEVYSDVLSAYKKQGHEGQFAPPAWAKLVLYLHSHRIAGRYTAVWTPIERPDLVLLVEDSQDKLPNATVLNLTNGATAHLLHAPAYSGAQALSGDCSQLAETQKASGNLSWLSTLFAGPTPEAAATHVAVLYNSLLKRKRNRNKPREDVTVQHRPRELTEEDRIIGVGADAHVLLDRADRRKDPSRV
jgi:hypothetical protein